MTKFTKISILAGSLTLATVIPTTTVALVNKQQQTKLQEELKKTNEDNANLKKALEERILIQEQFDNVESKYINEVLKVVKTANKSDTIYLAEDGTVKSTNEDDLHDQKITRIFRIGYWGKGKFVSAVIMPKTIQRLPNYLPKEINVLQLIFKSASEFNQALKWNTSNVTDMSSMFRDASSFNQALNWNTSNVTNMSNMFDGASKFNQDISGWNVNKVIKKGNFSWRSKLENKHLPKFNQ